MKAAILGAWHVHAKDYTKIALEVGEVVGVWDENPERCTKFAESMGIPAFASRDELLASDAEGVIVCSSTKRHTEDIIAAIRAKKAIFTEKVLALTKQECLQIREELEKARVPFVISCPQKYTSGILTVKSVLESGEIGKLNYIRFRNCHNGSTGDWLPKHFYSREECGGGAMIDLGAHGMYVIDMLRGLPDRYASTFGQFCTLDAVREKNTDRVEDNAVTVMAYDDGCIAINETGFVTVGCPMTLEVGGENGYVVFSGGKVVKNTLATQRKPVATELVPPLPAPIRQFMSGEILPGCGIEDAIHLTEMMEGAYANLH